MDPVKARFPAQPASVTAARGFVTDALRTAGAVERLDDARLLVSELATNAVVHARTDFTVTVHVGPGSLYLEVQDGAAGEPMLPGADVPEPDEVIDLRAEHGRGLRLVSVAADEWGFRRTDHGKVVWFRLDC